MPDTSHLVAALVGAALGLPAGMMLMGALLGGVDEDARRAIYQRGRQGAFEEMGRGHRKDVGSQMFDEIAEAVELAEWSRHG